MNCHPNVRALGACLWRSLVSGHQVLAVMALAFGLLSVSASAQEAATGTISGRVLNASNGKYLPNARVTVDGTNLETFTNEFGEYTLRNVPAGEVKLRAAFTGQATHTATLTVGSGEVETHDVQFGQPKEVREDGAIVLDEFTVETNRFQNAQELAINEERYSVNIKNVVAADAFGDVPSGNVGEFVKFLPGVEVEYGAEFTAPTDATGVSVRGFGVADTIIYVDGMPVSSQSPGSLTNATALDMLSINNASRVELIKVPTPDMPMDAIGGQINLISKRAFEYSKPSISFSAYMTVNTEYMDEIFHKVPGPTNEKVLSSMPGFDLTYVKPINEKLGFSVTLGSYHEFTANQRLQSEYRYEQDNGHTTNLDLRAFGGIRGARAANDQGEVSLVNPFLRQIQVTDSPRFSHRNSIAFTGDWKPFDGLRIGGRYSYSAYDSADSARRLLVRARRPMDWGPDYTISYPYLTAAQATAMGREAGTISSTQSLSAFNPSNSLDMDVTSRDKVGSSHNGAVDVEYAKGPWQIAASASASYSRGSFKDFENGHFSKVEMSSTIGQVKFLDIVEGLPGTVEVYDRNGDLFDWSDLSNWSVNNFKAYSGRAESSDEVYYYKADVRRELDFIPFDWISLAFKTGYSRQEKVQKKWGVGTGYRESYLGDDITLDQYADPVYAGISPGYGFPPQQWPSTYALYDFYLENKDQFTITEADAAENWFSYVGQNKRITTVNENWYAMFDGKTLKNRLSFIAGMRDGQQTREGFGPKYESKWNYVKNADGTIYRNPDLLGTATGTVRFDQPGSKLFATDAIGTALRADLDAQGLWYPTTAMNTATLARAQLQRQALQPVYGKSTGEPSYMIGAKYDITKKLVGAVNWSRKYNRVDLESGAAGILSGNGSYVFNEEEDPASAGIDGTISVANPNLQPQISNDWDFDLTYYSDTGGKFSLGYYIKNTSNFQETVILTSDSPLFDSILISLGEDPAEFDNWVLSSAYNVPGDTKTYGYELDVRQDLRALRFLGNWGKRIQLFGNYSTKKRKNPATAIDNVAYAEGTAAGGINIATERLSFLVRATWLDYRRYQKTTVTYDDEMYVLGNYYPSEVRLDANLSWRFSRKYSLFVSARDILNEGRKVERFIEGHPELYPAYANTIDQRSFGVNVTFGIKGSF